ncbi:hypothetical protein V6N13_125983 [Hibiscus sabdariffa]
MGGMEEEFENVGVVHREVTSGSRLFEPAIWMQCMTWMRAAKEAGEVTVAKVNWGVTDTEFLSVSKSNLGGHLLNNLKFEFEQMDNLNFYLEEGGLEITQQIKKTQCPTMELIQYKGLPRKVRSVNDLVIDTLPAEQRRRLLKRQGKGIGGKKQEGMRLGF